MVKSLSEIRTRAKIVYEKLYSLERKLEEQKRKLIDNRGLFAFLYQSSIERKIDEIQSERKDLDEEKGDLLKQYFQPLVSFLKANTAFSCQYHDIFILYKFLTPELKAPYQKFQYEISKNYQQNINPDPEKECSYGINVATLEWVVKTASRYYENRDQKFNFEKTALVRCSIPRTIELEYCIPEKSGGRIRVSMMKVESQIPWEYLVHDCSTCEKQFIKDPYYTGEKITTFGREKFCEDSCKDIYLRNHGYSHCQRCKNLYKDGIGNFCGKGCEFFDSHEKCLYCDDYFKKGEGDCGYCSSDCYYLDDGGD